MISQLSVQRQVQLTLQDLLVVWLFSLSLSLTATVFFLFSLLRCLSIRASKKQFSLFVPLCCFDLKFFFAAVEAQPPSTFTSRKEITDTKTMTVANTIGNIAISLSVKVSWEKRVTALRSLEELFSSGSVFHSDSPVSVTFLAEYIKEPLKLQLEDLRSAVSRTAALCVESLCLHSPDVFWAQMSDWFLPALFQNSCATVGAIAQSAHDALRCISARGVMSRSAVQHFLQFCNSKHMLLRRNAFLYLLNMITTVPHALLERILPQITKTLRDGLGDAVQEARSFARLGFWALESRHESSAAALYEGVAPAIQRTLDGAKDEFALWSATAPTAKKVLARTDLGAEQGVVDKDTATGAASQLPMPTPQNPPHKVTHVDANSTSEPMKPTTSTKPSPKPGVALLLKRAARQAAAAAVEKDANLSDDEWILVVDATKSTDWAARDNALRQIQSCLSLQPLARAAEVTAQTCPANHHHLPFHTRFVAAFSVTAQRVADSHYRVVLTACDLFDALMLRRPLLAAECLVECLSPLLANLSHSKDAVKAASRNVLKTISAAFDGHVLIPALFRVFDNVVGKVKVSAAEYFLFVVQSSSSYLVSVSNMKLCISRVWLHHRREKNSSSELALTLLSVLASFYNAATEAFVRSVLLLPPGDQAEFMALVQTTIPHLDQDCRRLSAGDRLLAHPDIRVASPFEKQLKESSPTGRLEQLTSEVERKNQKQPASGNKLAFLSPEERRAQDVQISPRVLGAYESPDKAYEPNDFFSSTAKNSDMYRNVADGSGQHRSPFAAYIKPLSSLNAHRMPPEGLTQLRICMTLEEKLAAIGIAQLELSSRDPRQWITHFNEYVPFAVTYCKDGNHLLRIRACQWLHAILVHVALQACTLSVLDSLLVSIADLVDDPFPEVRAEAVAALRGTWRCSLFTTAECSLATFRALVRFQSSSAPTRGWIFLLESLGTLVEAADPATTHESLPQFDLKWKTELGSIVKFLVATFSHELSEVRKTVVGVLVRYLFAFDATQIVPMLRPLTLSQQKLVSIYYNRSASDSGMAVAETRRDLTKEIELMCPP